MVRELVFPLDNGWWGGSVLPVGIKLGKQLVPIALATNASLLLGLAAQRPMVQWIVVAKHKRAAG